MKEKNKKHRGIAEIELLLTIGVVGVILIVVIPIFIPFIGDAKDTRTFADFNIVYRSTMAGITEWGMDSSSEKNIADFDYLDSCEESFEEFFKYFDNVMPYLHTLDEKADGDKDETTWRVKFLKNDKSFDTYIYNGEYVAINGGTPLKKSELIEK